MPYGKSNEHMDFCGTLTFSAQTYYALLHDIAGCIAKHGFKKLVLFNSHGGNTDMANLISRDLRILDLNDISEDEGAVPVPGGSNEH